MVGRESVRDPAEQLVAVDAAEERVEAGLVDRGVDLVVALDDGPPPRVDQRLLDVVHPAAEIHLARLEVEVPAGRAVALAARRCGTILDPGEPRPDVRLVRRLVLREPDVPVDPKR
jgi:hypothetical protein